MHRKPLQPLKPQHLLSSRNRLQKIQHILFLHLQWCLHNAPSTIETIGWWNKFNPANNRLMTTFNRPRNTTSPTRHTTHQDLHSENVFSSFLDIQCNGDHFFLRGRIDPRFTIFSLGNLSSRVCKKMVKMDFRNSSILFSIFFSIYSLFPSIVFSTCSIFSSIFCICFCFFTKSLLVIDQELNSLSWSSNLDSWLCISSFYSRVMDDLSRGLIGDVNFGETLAIWDKNTTTTIFSLYYQL
jgi:hypothetical protein